MEMELFLREDLRETRFYHRSGGDFHLVNFVEELKNDGKEEVICVVCEESAVLGPAFKCKACQYLCHVSCYDPSTIYFHFGLRHDQDQLIFTEELKNDGKDRAVCMVCQEEVQGPGYKCSASECNFYLHQSCAQLPREMHHPSHSNHGLFLQRGRASSSSCNACGKWCNTCLFYCCNKCDFNLDITCATRMRINNINNNCQHEFLQFFKQIHFTCEACGREGTDFASLCIICRLFSHSRCAGFPRTIRISRHDHALNLIYSLHHQVKDPSDVFCKICGQKVKTEYAAYCCAKCGFVAHLYCAEPYRFNDSSPIDDPLPEESVNVMEKINPGEIQHFSHPHNLILSHEEVLNDRLCDGCMHFIISASFYNCTQCNFSLHTRCTQLPRMKRHLLHRHRLSLVSQAPYKGGVFICNACGHIHHGFTYRCGRCDYDIDIQCFSIPETLKHEGHQHSLILPVSSDKNCNACEYGYKHSKDAGIFVCTACNFALGFECATLPPVARHKNDEHPLALTYVAENNSGEYYCLICEKKRDQKHWFYYCAKCDFSAHPQCVQGKNPYIKFGTTFKYKDHQHPITFVQKTEYSSPCDACGQTFDGMALECAQCEFNVHCWNLECLQQISDRMLHP